ncbi:hypothetical protein M2D07_023240 [Pseudomonas sp. BGr12]|uniref:hypothetical protein n=1 Tax=unclassified Pseudomonas TaxID=196821 RepID=UPI0017817088|nr:MULTISPECIES: hypothetical protein [unclassified Pseudomonas]MBD9504199.1 hypothetical protein [Pseudomonas sp. PDM17]MDL2429953.1 hypothetical protein [Pseudomonas sp. BJa5]
MANLNYLAKAVFALLGLLAIGSQASAEEVKVTELLRSGYEVKAAYVAPGRVTQIHFLILQKGTSVYQCGTYEASSLAQQFYDYSNTYSCSAVGDWVPKNAIPGLKQ